MAKARLENPLTSAFFDKDPVRLALDLLGKVLRHRYRDPRTGQALWLSAQIIEAEAYYRCEQGSHSSRGRSPSREAMFMAPGTIYMYYSRGRDSLNFSARGEGNAVLVKSARPYFDRRSPPSMLATMQGLNPDAGGRSRGVDDLCRGQTLLCQALGLRVPDWNERTFDAARFGLEDVGYRPSTVVQCRRLGITVGRDEHLLLRFVDRDYCHCCTQNPLTRRKENRCRLIDL